jgi:hypothetical protein
MWYQALQLLWEITNAKSRFSVSVVIEDRAPNGNSNNPKARALSTGDPATQTMDVRVTIRSSKTCTVARCHFLFDGQEIADPLHPAPLSLVSCKVSPVIGKPESVLSSSFSFLDGLGWEIVADCARFFFVVV